MLSICSEPFDLEQGHGSIKPFCILIGKFTMAAFEYIRRSDKTYECLWLPLLDFQSTYTYLHIQMSLVPEPVFFLSH